MSDLSDIRDKLARHERLDRDTVSALLRAYDRLRQLQAAEAVESPVGELPATPIMRSFQDRGVSLQGFHQAAVLRVPPGTLDLYVAALQAVVDHHDVMRLQLEAPPGDAWRLTVRDRGTVDAARHVRRVECLDPMPMDHRDVIAAKTKRAVSRLDILAGTTVEAVWFDRGPQIPGRLLLVLHHLVVDGVSWRILVSDLQSAVEALASHRTLQLPPKSLPFRAWARRLMTEATASTRTNELSYWVDMLGRSNLRLDGTVSTGDRPWSVQRLSVSIPCAVTTALLEVLSDVSDASIEEGLVTALWLAIVRWKRELGPVLVDIERHGRDVLSDDVDISRTVGWFTRIHPVLVGTADERVLDAAATAAIDVVKAQLRAVPREGSSFGLLRFLNRETAAVLAQCSTSDVVFNHMGRVRLTGDSDWQMDSESSAPEDPNDGSVAGYRLHLTTMVLDDAHGPTLRAEWMWCGSSASADELAKVAAGWRAAIEELAARPSDSTAAHGTLVSLSPSEMATIEREHGPIEDIWPLSPLQEGLLFHALFDADAPDSYVVQHVLDLSGTVDVAALREAASVLLRRHPNLRAIFLAKGTALPVQAIPRESPLLWQFYDYSGLDSAAAAQAADERFAAGRMERFDLERSPLLKFTLTKLAADHFRLAVTFHHLLLDGWSMPLLLRELLALHDRSGDATPLSAVAPYRGYLEWLKTQDRAAAAAVWRTELSGIDGPTLVAPRATRRGSSSAARRQAVTTIDAAPVVELARAMGVTISTIVQAAWAVLLSRFAARDDVVFGITVAVRSPEIAGIESIVGFLLNTVPLRVAVVPTHSARMLIEAVHASQLRTMSHQYLGLSAIQETVALPVLFDAALIFENYPATAGSPTGGLGLHIAPTAVHDRTHYPLTLCVAPLEGRFVLRLDFDEEVLDCQTIGDMGTELAGILESFSRSSSTPLGQIRIGAAAGGGPPAAAADVGGTCEQRRLEVLLRAVVGVRPDAVAVVCDGDHLTYATLLARARACADRLPRSDARTEMVSAVYLDRSVDLIVAIVAVLEAGAAYLPLDPAHPPGRTEMILRNGGVSAVLTTRDLAQRLPRTTAAIVFMDGPETGAETSAATGPGDSSAERSAYLIYTSGSTGTPKGVAISHRNVARLFESTRPTFEPTASDVWTLCHSCAFDFSVWEMWGALLHGGRLVIVPTTTSRAFDELPELIAREQVTMLSQTPSALQKLIAADRERADEWSRALRHIVLGGEALEVGQLLEWYGRHPGPSPAITNMYGITETTVHVTRCSMDRTVAAEGDSVIGQPLPDLRLYLLDHHLQPVPAGWLGELYVAGAGVGRGYRGQPALTAERFVANPFERTGARMYRTGDLAQYRADGRLVFAGRADRQVKIRGVRIELGEIESVLRSDARVENAAVLAEGAGDDKRLVAYVVGRSPHDQDLPRQLHDLLRATLPETMVPVAVQAIAAWPLTPNGKLDLAALPPVDLPVASRGAEPRTPEEEILCGLFADVLGLDHVSGDDDFFELGGHSLLATRLVSRIRAMLDVDLANRALFEAPTPTRLAARLRGAPKGRPPLRPRTRPTPMPVSYAQQRLWVVDRLGNSGTTYQMPVAFRIRGPLDSDALTRAAKQVVARHESLRTRFVEADSVPHQVITSNLDVPFPIEDLRGCSPDVQKDRVREALRAEWAQPLDLIAGPLLRLRLLRLADDHHVMLRTLHHIVTDAWSEGIFNRELLACYEAACAGVTAALPALPIQYADFVLWQREWVEHGSVDASVAYWRVQLRDVPEPLRLATERGGTGGGGFVAAAHHTTLPTDVLDAVEQLGLARRATTFMTLLSSFAVVLSRQTGQADLLIGTPIANRQDPQVEDLIGFFVNTLLLRVQVRPEQSFGQLVDSVRKTTLDAYQHQDVPFERLMEMVAPERRSDALPIVQAVFVMQNAPRTPPTLPGLVIEQIPDEHRPGRFDLEVVAEVVDRELHVTWLYDPRVFTQPRIEKLAAGFETVLSAAGTTAADSALGRFTVWTSGEEEEERGQATASPECAGPAAVVERFEMQVEATPNATALLALTSTHGDTLSYSDLNTRASQLAHFLIRRSVGAEAIVGLALESVDLIVAVLAVLKAGAAFLPLEPVYPERRRAAMIADARPALILTTRAGAAPYPGAIAIDDPAIAAEIGSAPTWNPRDRDRLTAVRPDHSAYVLYTSGSSGTPKGVVVTYAALASYLSWAVAKYDGSGVGAPLITPLAYDASLTSVFVPLLIGRAVYLPPEGRELEAIAGLLRDGCAFTLLKLTPAHLRVLADLIGHERMPHVRPGTLVVGGEQLFAPALKRWACLERLRVVNEYGPTEATVGCCIHDGGAIEGDGALPIGRAVPTARLYVLDQALGHLPAEVAGELYIAGPQLARGYLGRPAHTAARFVADPHGGPGTRMYRTGDRVWRGLDGRLHFVERVDRQVKIHGVRIELGEIESALRADPRILDAVAVPSANGDDTRILAYVVPKEAVDDAGKRAIAAEVSQEIRLSLPSAAVPSVVLVLDAWPLTVNGKLDVLALPQACGALEPVAAQPATPEEVVLCGLVAAVLGRTAVGVTDDFFALGGDSLMSIQLVANARAAGMQLTPRDVFQHRSVRGLCGATRRTVVAPSDPPLPLQGAFERILPLRPVGRLPPLFCLPPAVGIGWTYVGLMTGVHPERPVFCLQAVDLTEMTEFPGSVDAFADRYDELLREVQPHGPYHLLGWSFGGLVAHASACRLRAAGEEVRLLALVDAYPAVAWPVIDERFALDPAAVRAYVRDRLAERPTSGLGEAVLNRMAALVQHVSAVSHVFTPDTFDGDVLIFTASDTSERSRAWRPYVAGTIRYCDLPCTHQEIGEQQSLQAIGAALEESLRAAAAGSRPATSQPGDERSAR